MEIDSRGRFGSRGSRRVRRAHWCRVRWVALILILVLSFPEALAGRDKEVVARWEELAPLVERRDVETVLANGVYVRGRALKVLPEALEVEVRKTSDAALIPKGQTRIPRELLSVLTVRWKKRLGRVILTPLAGGTCLLCGVLILMGVDTDRLGGPTGFAMLGGSAAVGYLLGDRIDSKRMRIVLVGHKPPIQRSGEGERADGGIELQGGIPCLN